MNLGVALCIKTGLLANGVTPDVALNEPGSGIVHQDGTTGQWCYTWMLHSVNLGVALCIKTRLLDNGFTPECCTQ